ncbi:extracellular solute-binding protein [Alkalibacterium iburiense]|uniref:Extracellular solute-binding protein n=1 Tax=Alkalibacterium iburiense TaxID=290589 RepID=A0ABP3HAT5_9LACT
MFNKKRLIRASLVLPTLAVLAACGDGGGSAEEAEVDMTELPEAGDFSETIDLHLSGSLTQGNIEDGNYVQERLEEEFNVNIENTHVDTWDSNEQSIMIASGDLPDTFAFTGNDMTPNELYNNGLIRPIPREMIEEYAPLYTEMLNETDDGLGWDMFKHPENDDAYLALVGIQNHTQGILWAPTLRLDWMENLGLDIPDDIEPIGEDDGYERIYRTEHSYTIEELEEILRAFSEGDPDGNGSNDTYGLMPFNDNLNWSLTLMGAFGITPEYNFEENGELTHPMISERYKDYLLTLASWYEDGLIDPEWTTLSERTAWEKFQTGAAGYFIAQRAYLAQETWTQGRAPHNVLHQDEDAKLLVTGSEIGPEGHKGQPAYTPVTLLSDDDQMFISADVTDEQLARYLQMFDFMNHSDEGVWTVYGEPGEHSDWAGEEGESTLIVRDEYTREEGDTGFWAYNFRTYPGNRVLWLNTMETNQLMEDYFAVDEVVEENAIQPHRYDLFNETDEADVMARYGAQLRTIEEEFRMNGITGVIDIENDWDDYVNTWLNNGGQELLDELEKAPLVEDILGQ